MNLTQCHCLGLITYLQYQHMSHCRWPGLRRLHRDRGWGECLHRVCSSASGSGCRSAAPWSDTRHDPPSLQGTIHTRRHLQQVLADMFVYCTQPWLDPGWSESVSHIILQLKAVCQQMKTMFTPMFVKNCYSSLRAYDIMASSFFFRSSVGLNGRKTQSQRQAGDVRH